MLFVDINTSTKLVNRNHEVYSHTALHRALICYSTFHCTIHLEKQMVSWFIFSYLASHFKKSIQIFNLILSSICVLQTGLIVFYNKRGQGETRRNSNDCFCSSHNQRKCVNNNNSMGVIIVYVLIIPFSKNKHIYSAPYYLRQPINLAVSF